MNKRLQVVSNKLYSSLALLSLNNYSSLTLLSLNNIIMSFQQACEKCENF